jgi:hypothetical protein
LEASDAARFVGRELAPRELEQALARAGESPRPRILLDTYERFTVLGGFSITVILGDVPTWAADDTALAPVFIHGGDADLATTMVRRDLYDLTSGREGNDSSPVLAR